MTEQNSTPDPDVVVPDDEHKLAFVSGLVDRGEAIVAPKDGVLPPKVTHLIVGATDAGHPIVKRVRFSAF